MEKRLFEKYFTLPFKLDSWGMYVWGADDEMVMMFSDEEILSENPLFTAIIVDTINTGIKHTALEGKVFTNPNNDDEIFMDGEYLMCIRGWGYLTSSGGLNLSEDDATNIQDDLVDFILERLNQ